MTAWAQHDPLLKYAMDKKTLTPILQILQDPGPLDPDQANPLDSANFQRFYVEDLHDGHGDTITRLKLEIETSAGGRHAHLFSGTIGSGKSTELRRLANELRPDNYALVINAQEYLNPQLPLSISELLLAMALGIWEATAKELGIDSSSGERWAWLASLASAGVEFKEGELSGGFAKVKIALHSNPTTRERIRQFHEARLDTLVTEIQEFFTECADKIRTKKNLQRTAKMLLVVDSLEHFGGSAAPGQTDEVFVSLQRTFNTYATYLRLPDWTVVYSVPPLLHKLAPGIANAFGETSTYFLTSAHVFNDRAETLDLDTVDKKLVPLVRKRVGEGVVDQLISPAELQRIIEMTGGDLRDLIRCVRAVLLKALADNTFPVTQAHLEQTFNDLRRPYLPLSDKTRDRLRYVAQHHNVPLVDESDWPLIISDLTQKRVLLYLNGQEWYGVHPMLRQAIERTDVLSA